MRKIIHVDMDAFYASVEVRDRPDLKGKPIAVGGRPESRGVVATASYEARKFGVRSAIPSARAVRLCPDLILIPPRMSVYREASQVIRGVFRRYTDLIEPLSLDEAYLDVSSCTQLQGSATRIADAIRAEIFAETQLTASAGVAPNKFLAKVASDWNKPDGLTVITPAQVPEFVAALPVKKIPGVGKKSVPRLHAKGARTCGDLQSWTMTQLTEEFGRWGARLYDLCRGRDNRPVVTSRVRKQISVERTFAQDIGDPELLSAQLDRLYANFEERARGAEARIRGATVKVRFADFTTTTLDRSGEEVPSWDVFWELVTEALQRGGGQPVRLLGIGVRLSGGTLTNTRTGDPRQLWLFEDPEKTAV
ncbi:MAG: DNA polymerase IV [Myxococcales bacterium]|nr:DNA polymerase IV [Myxococcales bacterium]